MDHVFTLPSGRRVGVRDYGPAAAPPDAPAVLWCHGGPGSRFEPAPLAPYITDAGVRLVCIDRPGYGLSEPQPERAIADWAPEALFVADALDLDRFVAVGVSTGGAYALALAALAPERVVGVVACCALTDMRWAEGREMMRPTRLHEVWDAPDRATALAAAEAVLDFGDDGSFRLKDYEPGLAPADLALVDGGDGWPLGTGEAFAAMFAWDMAGFVDDRRADGVGWGSFDIAAVACPVTVVHGGSDTLVPVAHAHHTAALFPQAELRVVDELGHFSIVGEVLPAAAALLGVGDRT